MGLKERLVQSQNKAGLSNYKLAQMLGISKSTIANYKSGITKPPGPYLDAIAKILGVNKEWLKNGIGDEKSNSNNKISEIYRMEDSEKLKKIIKHFDLNQSKLSKSIGYEADIINKIINNHQEISKELSKAIAIKYRINLNWLLIGIGEMMDDPEILPSLKEEYYSKLKKLESRCQRQEGIINTLTKSIELFENKEKLQIDTEVIIKEFEEKCEKILIGTINKNLGKVDDWMEEIENKFLKNIKKDGQD